MLEDFDNDKEIGSKLFRESEFIDDVVKNVSKLTTIKSKKNISSLLEVALNELSGEYADSTSDNEDQLLLNDLDENQVWALIENYSKNCLKEIKSYQEKKYETVLNELKKFNENELGLNKKRKRSEPEEEEDIEEGEDSDKEYEDIDANNMNVDDNFDDDVIEEDEKVEEIPLKKEKNSKKFQKKGKDNFFSFEEMDKFAEEGELEMNDDNEEDKGKRGEDDEEFDDDDEIGEGDDLDNKEFKYDDFFDSADGKKNEEKQDSDVEEELEDEDIENNIFDIESKLIKNNKEETKEKKKSHNKNIEGEIQEIESKMMAKKDWSMIGEATSKQRPKGSLLENFLDFEVSVKPPPIPTPEYADTIENMIKLRIKDDLFDDPVRKPQIDVNKKNSNIEMDFEKNKKGLADLYEDDYTKDVLKISSSTEGQAIKNEIEELCGKLYGIFDKLTNNNFVSGNRNLEMKIITNVPAVQLEEISNYVTDNKLNTKSAHELYSMKDSEVKTREELTTEERKTGHKNWKRNVRNKLREKLRNKKFNALSKVADSKFEAKLMMKRDNDKSAKKNVKNSELKSSKFFSNLQNIASDDLDKKKMKSEKRNTTHVDNEFGNRNAKNYKI